MKKYAIFAVVLTALLMVGCGSPNELAEPGQANFWNGLWDGFTCWFAFIGNLFVEGEKWNIYEVHNNGWPYNLGFLLAVGWPFAGGSVRD